MIGWAFRHLFIWTILGGLAFVVHAHWGSLLDAGGDSGSARSSASVQNGTFGSVSRSMRVKMGPGGHFWVDAEVDGATVRFLVDTGASGVTLTPEDAERIGLHVRDRHFTERSHTAGGIVRKAPVKLREIRIGQLNVREVEASVNEKKMGFSLLGMSFLSRLEGYEVKGDTLVLYW